MKAGKKPTNQLYRANSLTGREFTGRHCIYFTAQNGHSIRHLEMGVIGAVYGWNGEWIRSPEEVGNRESTTEMFLIGLATGRPCSGTEGCFTQIDSSDELLDWYYDKMGDYIDFKTKREKEMPLV